MSEEVKMMLGVRGNDCICYPKSGTAMCREIFETYAPSFSQNQ